MTRPGLGRTILTFVIVGPPIGTAAFIGFMVGWETIKNGDPSVFSTLFNVIPFAIVFGYILGAIPATVSSLLVAWLFKRTDRVAIWIAAAPLAGALATWLGLFWVLAGPNGGESKWLVLAGYGFTGAIAALGSTLVVLAMTPRPKVT